MSDPKSTNSQFDELVKELQGRLTDEMSFTFFLWIAGEKARLYSMTHPFGDEVADKFPSAIGDIEEASKCLALDRGTACVFHLMRVMEVGLRVLAETLKDPELNPKRNPSWDSILKKCRKELEKPIRDRSPEWVADEPFFSGAACALMAVKDAWRNPTMHVEITYDEERAEDIWNCVKAFMRQLATKLHE